MLSVPQEIFLLILERAIPPYTLLDTTLSPGENSPWCQTLRLMQSLVLVSRGWYNAGVVFLYKNVCIRRGHQLESLRRTLEISSTKNLGLLVRSLEIQCYIPEDREIDFGADLEAVVGCCTLLSIFAYTAKFIPPAPVMINFPAYITHFRLEGNFHPDQLFAILTQLKETLRSFHLMIQCDQSGISQKLWPQLHLPSLQSLSVTILQRDKFDVLKILQSHLTMTSLQRFTVAGYDLIYWHRVNGQGNLHNAMIYLFAFLASHGGQLRQLHLNGSLFTPKHLKQALSFCPRLERIVLHPSSLLRKSWTKLDEFFHPHLRYVDLTHHLRDIDIYGPSALCLSKKNLPALEHVRRFCNFPSELLEWVDEYPPSIVAETEEFVIDVFQHRLDCRGGLFVWRFERDVLEGALEDNEDGFPNLNRCFGSFTVWRDFNTGSDGEYVHYEWDTSSSQSDSDVDCEWTSEDGLTV